MFTDDTLLKTSFFTVIMTSYIGSDITVLYDQIFSSNFNSNSNSNF